jgi:hypothetical protein
VRRALLVLALLGAGCSRPQVSLALRFAIDDGGAGECLPADDLACVNFVRFQLSAIGKDLFSRCIRVEERFATLCDLERLANGGELFRGDPDDVVSIAVEGLRMFPATSCEQTTDCRPRRIFTGGTGVVRLGDVAGGSVPLVIDNYLGCGPREEFRARLPGQSCDLVCDTARGNIVSCVVEDGCVCAVVSPSLDGGAGPDAGVPRDAAPAALDAGLAALDAGAAPDASAAPADGGS